MASVARPLKIGLVYDDSLDEPDGVVQYVLTIGEWLHGQGHDVHYLVGASHRPDISNVHSLSRNLSVRFNGNRMSTPLPTSRRKLRTFLAAQQFDVLHVQVPYSPFLAHRLIMAVGRRTAVIGTFHIITSGRLAHTATRLLGGWTRDSLRRFDVLVSVSGAAAEFALATFGVDSQVVPNVIDYPRFHAARPLKRYSDEALNILFLGRLVPRKGCQQLLTAVNQIVEREDVPKFRVLICGKGPLAGKLQAYTAEHKLNGLVEFVGFVSEADKPRYYASAAVAVFPSSGGESFGIVLLEAMASGRAAVLAGDNPGYRSVMTQRPELLFDPHDAAALADKLVDFLLDAKRRRAAAAWGEDYSRGFDTPFIGSRLVGLYRQALRKRRQA